MRKFLAVALFLCVALVNTGCEIPDVIVSTIISEGNTVASKVAVALTETAVAGGAAVTPEGTLPSGGGPEETPTVDLGPTATQTLMPTADLPHLRVAFISGGSPWLVAPPAPAYALSAQTGVDSVDISDDGQMVAYVRHTSFDQPGELRVVNWDGSGDRALLTSAQVGALEPLPAGAAFIDLYQVKWIPGTHNLFVNTKIQYEGPGLGRSDDLFLINAETGVLTNIFTPGNAGEIWPSPDGAKMVISRSTYLSLANIDGSGVIPNVVTFPSIITYSEYQYYPEPVWAADSSRFGVVIASEDPLAAATTGSIWLVNASTGAATLAATMNGNFFFPHAVLSPTLTHVGYVVPTADPAVRESHVSTLDGSFGLHLADGNTGVDTFSPDGQYFSYYVGSGTADWIGSLGGGTFLVPGGAMRLTWYNNTHFVYASGTTAAWTIKMGDTGGASTVIATPSGDRTSIDVDE
ncbi:MAG: hypothetical protein JW748_13570 [Anaerolineales bacterium]|nr:hypothetical protein [Anaerolineales bacterium]